MNKTLKWVLIGLGIAVAVFLIALPIFRMGMSGGNLRMERMGGFASGTMMPFGGMFLALRFFHFLLPLGVLALAVVGVVLLVRNSRRGNVAPPQTPAAVRSCSKCGKALIVEGEFCPYCGEKQ